MPWLGRTYDALALALAARGLDPVLRNHFLQVRLGVRVLPIWGQAVQGRCSTRMQQTEGER